MKAPQAVVVVRSVKRFDERYDNSAAQRIAALAAPAGGPLSQPVASLTPPATPHYLVRFCAEQTITVNTTAAGGNAALLAMS